jgi:hypothetical protein
LNLYLPSDLRKAVLCLFILLAYFSDGFSQTLNSVVNQYSAVLSPATLSQGSSVFEVEDGSLFSPNSSALLVQMKGAGVVNTSGTTYGNISAINSAGVYEFVRISSVSGNQITVSGCLKNSYQVSGKVQLVSVPVYNNDQTVAVNDKVTSIRLTHKGYGYATAPTVTLTAPTGPLTPKVTATAVADIDANGQLVRIRITNPGSGYSNPPLVSIGNPAAPYNFVSYRAAAVAQIGLTCKQWDGTTGGILAFVVKGNLTFNDSIRVNGMGFSGGTLGTSGGSGTCFTSDFTSFGSFTSATIPETQLASSGLKGESISDFQTNHYRGRGKFANGGGAGGRGEAGGGGGGNYGAGGQGGRNGSNAVFLCTGTNGSGRAGAELATFGYGTGTSNRIFLGGGGGGGHAYNGTFSSANGNNSGGFGGGIVIISAYSITGNNRAIKANGGSCATIISDGASGGGGGGVVLIDCPTVSGNLSIEAQGGKGGNTDRLSCCTTTCTTSACSNREGPGGGGGGGVVWFSSSAVPAGITTNVSGGTGGLCVDQGNDPYGATGGSAGAVLTNASFQMEGPYGGTLYSVGSFSLVPRPDFPDLATAINRFNSAGLVSNTVTLEVRTGNYPQPVVIQPFTDGCAPVSVDLTIQSQTGNPADVVLNAPTDALACNGFGQLTLKDIRLQATDLSSRSLWIYGGSSVELDHVEILGQTAMGPTGSNGLMVDNAILSGDLLVGPGSTLSVSDSLKLSGTLPGATQLVLQNGSIFQQSAGSRLILVGADWINQGATLNLNALSDWKLAGSSDLEIGGTSSTAANRIRVSLTAQINVTQPLTAKSWLQSSSASILGNTHLIQIQDSLVLANGLSVHSAPGRFLLGGTPGLPSVLQGEFGRLELSHPDHFQAIGNIKVNQQLHLNQGILHLNGFGLWISDPNAGALSAGTNGWVNGTIRRSVGVGTGFIFPVGNASQKENVWLDLVSVSGGLSELSTQFVEGDPETSPFVPATEAIFPYSGLLSDGFWRIEANTGSAQYNLRLYPTFFSAFSPFTIYKRSNPGASWLLSGSLDNPSSSFDFIQPDGSIRRSGLNGFSDFAVAETVEDPLPLGFYSAEASRCQDRIHLSWKHGTGTDPNHFVVLSKSFDGKWTERSLSISQKGSLFASSIIDPEKEVESLYLQYRPIERGTETLQLIPIANCAGPKRNLRVENGKIRFEVAQKGTLRIISPEGKILQTLELPEGTVEIDRLKTWPPSLCLFRWESPAEAWQEWIVPAW